MRRVLERRTVLLAAAAAGVPRLGHAAKPRKLVPVDAAATMALVKKPGARAVLLNVWATWCEPCREEMPELLRFYRRHKKKGVRLVLVSADGKDEAAEAAAFLAKLGVRFETYIKAQPDMQYIDGIDKRWQGTLPASFLFDGAGVVREMWQKQVTAAELDEALAALPPASPGTK